MSDIPVLHTVAVASAGATLRLTVRPGCTEREVMDLARWAWSEAQALRGAAPVEREGCHG